MDFKEALNCVIKKWMFLVRRKIDDISDEEAVDDNGEESTTSNFPKRYSCDPHGWGEIKDVVESTG